MRKDYQNFEQEGCKVGVRVLYFSPILHRDSQRNKSRQTSLKSSIPINLSNASRDQVFTSDAR